MVTGDLSTAPSATAFAYTAFKRWNVFLRGVAPPKLSKLASHRFMSSVVMPVRGYPKRVPRRVPEMLTLVDFPVHCRLCRMP